VSAATVSFLENHSEAEHLVHSASNSLNRSGMTQSMLCTCCWDIRTRSFSNLGASQCQCESQRPPVVRGGNSLPFSTCACAFANFSEACCGEEPESARNIRFQ
jgi:hypothetical protein